MDQLAIRPEPSLSIAHSSSEESRPPGPGLARASRKDTDSSSGDNPRFKRSPRAQQRDSFGPGVRGLPAGVRGRESSDEEEESSDSLEAALAARRASGLLPRGAGLRGSLSAPDVKLSPGAARRTLGQARQQEEGGEEQKQEQKEEQKQKEEEEQNEKEEKEEEEKEKEEVGAEGREKENTAADESESSSDQRPLPVKVDRLIRATPKLGKLLGDAPPPSSGREPPRPRGRQRSLTVGEPPAELSASGDGSRGAGTGENSGGASPRSNTDKISKFFGTVISQDTASALQSKSKTLRVPSTRRSGFARGSETTGSPSSPPSGTVSPGGMSLSSARLPRNVGSTNVPVTRHRRSSSVGTHDSSSWTRQRSPQARSPQPRSPRSGASGGTSPRAPGAPVTSGRLSMTMWRPSGLLGKEKFYFEVVVDYTVVYKSPPMHNKKLEWVCNVCVDASLDSLIMIRLYRGAKITNDLVPSKCHVTLRDLALGTEMCTVCEFPDGERQQVTLLPLDFGAVEGRSSPARGGLSTSDGGIFLSEEVPIDAPNVTDVQIVAVHDLRGVDARKQLVLQASYSDQVARSSKFSPEADSAHVGELRFEATFRLCAASTQLQIMLMQGDSFPGAAVAATKVSLARVASGPQPALVPLRDREGRTRLFVQLRLTVSSPMRGLLAPMGMPLAGGIPFRVNWGDVVLFNLKSLNAQIVSAATASSWDHCGIVYEEGGKLFLLEAVSGGVQTPELHGRLIDALNAGAKIGFRHLNVARTPELRAELWSFAVGMTGRSYKKSVGQLVSSRWGRNKADDLSSVFCSELVAAAYKQLELVSDTLVTSNVLPKDIAVGELPWLLGASLLPLVSYSSRVFTLLRQESKRNSDIYADWAQEEDDSM